MSSRNPYAEAGVKPIQRKSIFAFIDILGYSELMRSDPSNTELQRLHKVLEGGRDWLEEKYVDEKFKNFMPKDLHALKAFTDNVVMGWPIRSDGESELGSALFKLSHFQMEMALEGYFIRGAISVGDVYIDEIAVFGPALLEAHAGESILARDPRIIITDSVIPMVNAHLNYYARKKHAPHCNYLLRDSDGKWFVNYLNVLIPDVDYPLPDELIQHKEIVEKLLDKYSGHPVIWSKYAWVAKYHNYFCEKNSYHFDESHKIDIRKYEAEFAEIV